MMNWKEFDFYRKIPRDLTEGSIYGTVLSFFTFILIIYLIFSELFAFIFVSHETVVRIDSINDDQLLQINFDITLLDISCSYAVVDIVDVLGTRINNVTYHVQKYDVDSNGNKKLFEGINPEDMDIFHERLNHLTDEDIFGGEVQALEVSEDDFEEWLKNHPNVFVNFYTPWCHWCQELEPIWELTAQSCHLESLPINLIKVNCDNNLKLCEKYKIKAFPTLRYFRHHLSVSPDYHEHRTIEDLMKYVREMLGVDPRKFKQQYKKQLKNNELNSNVGCQLTGNLLLNRVPGDFRLEARSWTQILNPLMTNISHVIHHLSFGPVLDSSQLSDLSTISDDYFSLSSLHPMDQQSFILHELHRGYHHYLEAVPTTLEVHNLRHLLDQTKILTYQLVQASQIMDYHEESIPSIVFSYDISPISVFIRQQSTPWYDFLTSLCAILGGTISVFTLLASLVTSLFHHKSTL